MMDRLKTCPKQKKNDGQVENLSYESNPSLQLF